MSITAFEAHPGQPFLELCHGDVRIVLSMQGAHLTHYEVAGEQLLWLSDSTVYAPGVAIRGGIPLCWPWFGASLDDVSWPQHGFARKSPFRLVSQHEDTAHVSVVLAFEKDTSISP